jgi:acetyl esterase
MQKEETKILLKARRARKLYAALPKGLQPQIMFGGTEREYPVPTPAGITPVFLYYPVGEQHRHLPVFVNIHGGGFIQGSAMDDRLWCQQIVENVGCCVVNIEYRLSPEYRFPVALEECYAVIRWVTEQTKNLGIDANRIAVGGHSAGGNLSAALCLLTRQRQEFSLCYQILDYPSLDMSRDPFLQSTTDTLLTPKVRAFFTDCYVSTAEQGRNSLVSPLLAPNLGGLPPALIITAEHDPLRQEGEEYADRLREAGVAVTYRMFAGCMHAFTHFGPAQASEDAWALISEKLRQAFD